MMKRQAAQFGAEFLQAEVKKASVNGEEKQVETGKGILRSRGLLIASGSHPKRVGFEGETEFTGKGVSYCAVCDGAFIKESRGCDRRRAVCCAGKSVFDQVCQPCDHADPP